MADPNWDAVTEMISFGIVASDHMQTETSTVTLTDLENWRNDLEGDFAQATRDRIQSFRDAIANALSREQTADMLSEMLDQLGVAISSPFADGDADLLWQDVYDYMITNSKTVKSRNFTYGTPALPSGNTGNGEVIRLTVDEQGHFLEGWFTDVYSMECTSDARQTGQKHTELWKLEGTDASPDGLILTGTALTVEGIQSLNASHSKAFVKNPSWNDYTGTAEGIPTAIAGWTVGSSLSNFVMSEALTYRSTPGESVSASIKFTDNDSIKQDLVDQANATIDPDAAYLIGPTVYRKDTATGTLTMRLSDSTLTGGLARAITVGGLSDDAWTRQWMVSTPAANNWSLNWSRVNDLTLSFTLASLATGTVYLDDLIFSPFQRIGAGNDARRGRGAMGTYLAIVGGSTPWVRKDTASWTDTETGSVNAEWFARANRGYLASETDPTWVDK